MSEQRIRERILAIYNLVQRAGTPGEMAAAKSRLDEMLKKYNIDLNTIFEQKKDWHFFTYGNKWEKALLFQTVFKVTNQKGSMTYRRITSRKLAFELTAEQAIDVELLYTAYKKAFKKEVELLLSAFLSTNRIFSESDDDESDVPELTPERIAYLQRLMDAMRGMSPVIDPRSNGYLGAGK